MIFYRKRVEGGIRMTDQEMERFLEQLTVEERHRMFMILRRLHVRDCMRKRKEDEKRETRG